MELLASARIELVEATERYVAVSEKLAEMFLDEIEAAFLEISRTPKAWPAGKWGTRRYVLHRFPYVVVYVDGKEPVVIAIAHGKRKPEYWKDRVGDAE